MWAQENPNILFYYQETRSKIGGELLGSNIPFTINSKSLVGNDDTTIWSSKCDCNQCYFWNK